MPEKPATPTTEKAPDELPFLLLILGGVSFDFVPHWRLNRFYAEGRCVVLDERAKEAEADNEGRGSAWREFLIRYEAGGREHEAWARPTVDTTPAWRWPKEPLAVGEEQPCWYDPADPSRVMVGRGYGYFGFGSLLALVMVSLVCMDIRRRRVARRAAEGAAAGRSRGGRPGGNPAGSTAGRARGFLGPARQAGHRDPGVRPHRRGVVGVALRRAGLVRHGGRRADRTGARVGGRGGGLALERSVTAASQLSTVWVE